MRVPTASAAETQPFPHETSHGPAGRRRRMCQGCTSTLSLVQRANRAARSGDADTMRPEIPAVPDLNQLLLFLHFLGLGLGATASFGAPVIGKLIENASEAERPILARVPAALSHVSGAGLLLLWATGLVLVFTKWGGFGSLPWQFHVKITGVVLLTGTVGMIHAHQAKAKRGDRAAAARIPTIGLVSTALTVLIVLFAVLAFD